MPAEKISLEHAKSDKLMYFVVNAVIYRESDGRCLILKRSMNEKAHPGRYATPGGKLEWGQFDLSKPSRINGDILDFDNALEELLMREVAEEAGVTIHPDLTYLKSVFFVRPDGIPVILIKMAARYKDGEVKVEEGAFDGYAWVNEDEARHYECIDGTPEEIAAAVRLYQQERVST